MHNWGLVNTCNYHMITLLLHKRWWLVIGSSLSPRTAPSHTPFKNGFSLVLYVCFCVWVRAHGCKGGVYIHTKKIMGWSEGNIDRSWFILFQYCLKGPNSYEEEGWIPSAFTHWDSLHTHGCWFVMAFLLLQRSLSIALVGLELIFCWVGWSWTWTHRFACLCLPGAGIN